MDDKTFFSIYLPALSKSFENDHINYGFHVKSPEYFIEESQLTDIDSYLESDTIYDDFFDMVGYYFDAKSHNFPSIDGIEINRYKNKIKYKAEEIKTKLNI